MLHEGDIDIANHNNPSTVAELSVADISAMIKATMEATFSEVRVRGEISGLSIASSGHVYFTLKDQQASLSCIAWRGIAAMIPFKLAEGLQIVVIGKVTTYPARSNYQLIISKVEMGGIGALLAMLEERKKKFQALGYFDPARKKPIPLYPKRIGIVTSPTGAVIRDIIHRIKERYPLHIIIWPTLVQGPNAADQVAAAIDGFNNLDEDKKPDLIIVARGGGSVEDLWAFNEEIVCVATYNSKLPVISAIGHETDTTLIDYISDKRAPTPTAAAEFVTPVLAELKLAIKNQDTRLYNSMSNLMLIKQKTLKQLSKFDILLKNLIIHNDARLQKISHKIVKALADMLLIKNKHLAASNRLSISMVLFVFTKNSNLLEQLTKRLNAIIVQVIEQKQKTLELYQNLLKALDYKNVLDRGFVIARDENGGVISSKAMVKSKFVVEFKDGSITAQKL